MQSLADIPNAEKKYQNKDERESAIDENSLHENLRDDRGRIPHLLAHVNGSVEALNSVSQILAYYPDYLPRKQYVTVSRPMHHEIPSLFHPPSFTTAVNTNSAVLRRDNSTRGTTIMTKAAT